jgi:hypothetical protein
MLARTRKYRCFFAAKRAWTVLLDTLPASLAQALRHYVQLPANDVFRLMNRRGRAVPPGQEGARNSLAHNPM